MRYAKHARLVILMMTALITAIAAHAQESITISAPSSLPTFQLGSGTGPTGADSLSVTTTWKSTGLLWSAQVSVCSYMTAPLRGTGTNTDTIPASAVFVNNTSISTGTVACGQPNAYQIATWQVTIFGCFGGNSSTCSQNGSQTSNVSVLLNGYSANLEPDTYTGTIYLIASIQ